MQDNTKLYIERQYNEIIKQLKNGSLYGEKIDLNNNEMVVVAAYFLGLHEGGLYKTYEFDK